MTGRPRCGNDPRAQLTPGDRAAVAEFRAFLTARALEKTVSAVAPNPRSPYASADPQYRHIFPSPIFFPTPTPGVLAPAACDLMAVVPDDLIETTPGAPLPEGLCPACVTVMQGGRPPRHASSECGECGAATWHDGLCALCRQEKHEAWWPTRDQANEEPT